MKIFISSDIEGTNGICSWEETGGNTTHFNYFTAKMTSEVLAVCNGINTFDLNSEILVKDAHGTGRNIDHAKLPENVALNRGFSSHPFTMMDLIDSSFDASMVTGYHSPAYSGGTPLAHTMSGKYPRVLINGRVASEFLINYYTSLYVGVPMVLAAGDRNLMELVKETDPDIVTVDTVRGFGDSVTSEHPDVSLRRLQEAAEKAVSNADRLKALVKDKLPKHFTVEIRFGKHYDAFKASFFPGVTKIDDLTIGFECDNYFEFLRMFMFV